MVENELQSKRTTEFTTTKLIAVPKPPLDDGEGKTLTVKNTCLRAPTTLVPESKDHRNTTMGNPKTSRNSHPVETGKRSKDHTSCHAPLAAKTKADADGGLMAPTLQHNHTQRSFEPTGLMELLLPPTLTDGTAVTGTTKNKLRIDNKKQRRRAQCDQPDDIQWWISHKEDFVLPEPLPPLAHHRNNMCPAGLALHHPASDLLKLYATLGCPTNTGLNWSHEQIQAAIDRGPHESALDPDAIKQLHMEVEEKVKLGQARVVNWDDLKSNPPPELKISPLAMIPHKSRNFRAILDLSFPVKLNNDTVGPSVNDGTTKTAPRGAISQIGHSLTRIIHAFATADPLAKIFMAKWDIKDGFWRLDCEEGQEWNFCYVLPNTDPSAPVQLVVPTSLQMGWIESPPFFCAASETARDVAEQYIQLPLKALPQHKFTPLTITHEDARRLPESLNTNEQLKFLLEVFMDDYIGLTIPTTIGQLRHVSNAVMYGIHDIFPPHSDETMDPISWHKLVKGDGAWAVEKDILGLTFDGDAKTVWLDNKKRDALLTILTGWIRAGRDKRFGIAFNEFQSVIAKIRHAFITIPAGRGLMSPFNKILSAKPNRIFLHNNDDIRTALICCRAFLRESVGNPTKCASLVTAWPDYVGITDASSFGAGGVIIGENKATPLTVFRVQWPADITAAIITDSNPTGTLTNNDLEMAGLLFLWLAIEGTCADLEGSHVALFSDNTPTVAWVTRMASRKSKVAMKLVRALALRLQIMRTSPLTPMHIKGIDNSMTDIPSRSFGSEPKWKCNTNEELLTLFNITFPPPPQASWNVFQLSPEICTKVISILRTQASTVDEWRRLQKRGTYTGDIGPPTSHLWDWTLSFETSHTPTKFEHSRALQDESELDSMGAVAKLQLQQSIRRSQPLARRSPWPLEQIQQKCEEHKTN